MRALVLGGAGFVGRRVVAHLAAKGWQVCVASRRPGPFDESGISVQALDALDRAKLAPAVARCDAVINCVTGSTQAIVEGARALAAAVSSTGPRIVVHMSSMAVYGDAEGDLDEEAALGPAQGWYVTAKRQAEQILGELADRGCRCTFLRPGCVYGPGSYLWVWRFGSWLRTRRIGYLAEAGDGWSNLVHVDDVATAAHCALEHGATSAAASLRIINLAAPDSPRWNTYIAKLGVAVGAVPLRVVSGRQLKADALFASIPTRLWERVGPKLGVPQRWVPPAIAPSLLGLLGAERRLVSRVASDMLDGQWHGLDVGVAQSAEWFNRVWLGGDQA